MKNKIKVSIAIDSTEVSAWKIALMEKIQQSFSAEIVLIFLLKKSKSSSPKNTLFSLHRKLDARLFKPSPDAFAKKNIQVHFPKIKIDAIDASIEPATSDVIVWLSDQVPPADLYTKSRFGVWFYTHGKRSFETTSDELIGHTAFFQKQETSTSSLCIKLRADIVIKSIYQSWSMPHAYSLTRSQNEQAWKIASFVPRILEDLYQSNEIVFLEKIKALDAAETFDFPAKNNTITFSKSLLNVFRHFLFLAKRKMDNIRFNRQWILLFSLEKKSTRAFATFKKLLPPKDKFWADPFLWLQGGRHFVFFEELPFATKKGYISVLEILKNGETTSPQKVLELPYHLSYPFLFEFEKKLYMIPESFSARNIQLFECIQFPNKWQHKMNLMTDVVAADTTLFFHQNKWWLFTNMVENEGGSLDDELYLFYADTPLTSDWIPHPKNSIVSDVRRARPAGNLFWKDGKLIRPSQDCSKVYGFGLNFNEIKILSESEYEEELLENIRPTFDPKIKRLHSFNHLDDLTIIDGMIHL